MPSLKEYLKAFAQSIGLPKSNAAVFLEAPAINDWSHTYIAPSNGTVYMYVAGCAGVNLTNTSTTAMQTTVIRDAGNITLDSAFCIRAKKATQSLFTTPVLKQVRTFVAGLFPTQALNFAQGGAL